MNKIISVRSEQQPPKNSPETPPPGVPIPSLKKAIAFVNAQESLSTEDLFKTLLMCHDRKPDQGPLDTQFLTEAIKKGASSQGSVSVETQKRIALAIYDGIFGKPIPSDVALALVSKLDTFKDRGAQQDIALAIVEGKFGDPIRDEVALALVSKLDTFIDPEARRNIALAILTGKFGVGGERRFLDLTRHTALVSSLCNTFTDSEAKEIINGNIFVGKAIPQDVLDAIIPKLGTFTDPEAQRHISKALQCSIFMERSGRGIYT